MGGKPVDTSIEENQNKANERRKAVTKSADASETRISHRNRGDITCLSPSTALGVTA